MRTSLGLVASSSLVHLFQSIAEYVDNRICNELELPSGRHPWSSGEASLLQFRQSLPESALLSGNAPMIVSVPTKRSRNVLWINAFGRSGSSLVLSMIQSSGPDVFTLYEPCHQGDKLTQDLAAQGCLGLLHDLAQCNFSGIEDLWGWTNERTTNSDRVYSKQLATRLCTSASLVAFKTIDQVVDVSSTMFEELWANPQLRIINVVRDPRSIYASRQLTPGTFSGRDHINTIWDICNSFAESSNVSHPRFMQLVYENLVTNATLITRRVQEFLGRKFTQRSQKWIHDNFNSPCESKGPYSVCRENATASLYKYRDTLSNNEYAAFMAYRECRKVSELYGYEPYYFQEDELEPYLYSILKRPWFVVLSCVAAAVCGMGMFPFCYRDSLGRKSP